MFKVHQIVKYNYSYDARLGAAGRLQLWGTQAKVAEIIFVPDGTPVPAPVLWPNLTGANAAFRASAAAGLIDMLRNEGPISLTVNDQPPGFAFVHTGLEPVAEEEKQNV